MAKGRLLIGLVPPSADKDDKKDEPESAEEESNERHPGLLAAADALADALGIKPESIDRDAVADALYDAFSICDGMPHEEGEHEGEEEE